MRAAAVAKGLLTWIPGVQRAFFDRTAGGGTASPAYCYGVWIKHLTLLWAHGMATVPRDVVELGPGTSLGTGIAALLSGASRYAGIDAVAHMRPRSNFEAFYGLVPLFRNRAPRPVKGFPDFDGYLDANLFPGRLLDDARLEASLDPARLERIEASLKALERGESDGMIRYGTWESPREIVDGEVDLVLSHVVLNHVEKLDGLYATLARWLRPGGWMSHQIDFTSLGTAADWNGHWGYGELEWSVISGRRPYFVSREPPAKHLALAERHGFEVVEFLRHCRPDGIGRARLAPRWRSVSDADLVTQKGFLIARRR